MRGTLATSHIRLLVTLALATAGAGSAVADSPEKLDHPEALRQQVDRLREQDHWTDFGTPEQIELYSGPETEWPELPRSAYNLTGFSRRLLGSKVPPPGVHPRVLFSPEDIPAIRRKIMDSDVGRREWATAEFIFQKTLFDPDSDDGKVFAKLADGDLDGLEFPDDGAQGGNGRHVFNRYRGRIYPAHVCYWPYNLHSVGFYALIKGDDELGTRVADALVNYYKLREPLIDKQNARGDEPNAGDGWPRDVWRQMHYVAGEGHLGLAYDVTAKWMTDEQKDFMRRIIVKATAGKRSYGANGPVRWRTTNWVGWDLQHVLTHLAIEGQEGFEPEIVENAAETIYGYLTYGISPQGTIFETNGKNGAGLHFALTTAVALARRDYDYLLGHPHLRKMSASQVHQVVPAGGRNVSNGTYGCALFGQGGLLKNLYPDDKCADWLILQGQQRLKPFDLDAYETELAKEGNGTVHWWRIHPLTSDSYLDMAGYEGTTRSDGTPKEGWERDYLGLPLDFADEEHGQLCTRSSNDRDALYLMFEARPDLFSGGHQHHDAGHFYLSAHGVDWGVEGNNGLRSSLIHSVVMIDAKGQGAAQHFSPMRAGSFTARATDDAAFAWADLKNAYDYIGTCPMHYSWGHPQRKQYDWEPDTDPFVVACYKGTQHWKARIWMHSYWNWNWGPQMRAEYNPVKYAYRTAGVVRGPHPYALIVDDVNKDDNLHVYDWQMQIPGGLTLASWWKMPQEQIVLVREEDAEQKDRFTSPKKAVPCLAVLVLNKTREPRQGEYDRSFAPAEIRRQSITGTERLVISTRAVDPNFRIALVPFHWGAQMPQVLTGNDASTCKLQWTENGKSDGRIAQEDVLTFKLGEDGRTRLAVSRDNRVVGALE